MANLNEILKFDGLGPSETAVANGYGGLRWTNVDVYQPSPSEHDGYAKDLHSGDSVAYNGGGATAEIQSAKYFHLHSGYFAAALENDVTVTFTAYRAGKEVGEVTRTLIEHSHLIRFPPSFQNLNEVVITTSNSVNPTITQVAMENLSVSVRTAHHASTTADLQHHDASHALDPLSGLDLHHAGGDFVV